MAAPGFVPFAEWAAKRIDQDEVVGAQSSVDHAFCCEFLPTSERRIAADSVVDEHALRRFNMVHRKSELVQGLSAPSYAPESQLTCYSV